MREHRATANQVEIGWLVLGQLEDIDRDAVRKARDGTLALLRRELPEFAWRMPLLERRDLRQLNQVQPTVLIERGIEERDLGHLDFVFVMTGAELVAHSRPVAIAVASRSAGVGVFSTARIDPHARGEEVGNAVRRERMKQRLMGLALHVLGDLVGCPHDGEGGSAMRPVDSIEGLDEISGYGPQARQVLGPALRQIADLRLEESQSPSSRFLFYLRATRMNTTEILEACWRAQPWRLPFRLARLSAAAVSTLVVVTVSAEGWELATHLTPQVIAALSLLSLSSSVAYVVRQQRLLMSRRTATPTEQIVVADVSVTLIVGLGLLAAYLLLFGLAAIVGSALVPPDVASSWSRQPAIGVQELARFAGFCAALALIIGALGASFESRDFFRHLTYVDEEMG